MKQVAHIRQGTECNAACLSGTDRECDGYRRAQRTVQCEQHTRTYQLRIYLTMRCSTCVQQENRGDRITRKSPKRGNRNTHIHMDKRARDTECTRDYASLATREAAHRKKNKSNQRELRIRMSIADRYQRSEAEEKANNTIMKNRRENNRYKGSLGGEMRKHKGGPGGPNLDFFRRWEGTHIVAMAARPRLQAISLAGPPPPPPSRPFACGRVFEAFYGRGSVLPNVSEAPHLRSSVPIGSDLSKTQTASRWIIPWPKYTVTSFFETRFRHSDDCGLRNPILQKKKKAELCYLYRRTRHLCQRPVPRLYATIACRTTALLLFTP